MKSTLKLLLVLGSLLSMPFASHSQEIVYDFETADESEGWEKFNASGTLVVTGGNMSTNTLNNFGGVRTGAGLNLDGSLYTRMVIVMKNETSFSEFQVINYETGSTSGSTAALADFTVSVGDAEFKSYTVIIPTAPAANSGVIDRLGIRAKGNPSDETISFQKISLLPNNAFLDWTFDNADDLEGWSVSNATASVANGMLTMTMDGSNPPRIAISGLGVATADYPSISVRVKNNTAIDNDGSNNGNSMRVVAITTASTGNTFKPFNHSANDGDFQTYEIDFSSNGNYTGDVTELYFEGIRDGSTIGTIDIDRITLVPAFSTFAFTSGVSGNGTIDLATGDYAEDEYTINAAPTFGNEFVNWTNGDDMAVSTDAAYTFTLDADLTLTANFQPTTTTTIGWYFDEDEEGWGTVGGAAVSAVQADGALTFSINATSGNPRIEVTGLAVNAADFPYARLTVKNSTSVTADGTAGGVGMRFRSDNSEAALGLRIRTFCF